MTNIVAFKQRFDGLLARCLDRKRKEMRALTSDPYILSIIAHARKLVLRGGKRIRPYLAYLSYRTAGGRDRDIIRTLVGLELFHAFALVHDDIMDRGRTRHGVQTAHERFGDAQAILAGDLLFNWAAEIIAPTKGRAVFARMVDEVILGQMLDVDAARRTKVSDAFIEDKMRLKTASYSFVRPLQFGAALAGKPLMFAFCEKFGLPLGLAFQIQDDLLDLTASSKKLGKSSMNDVREGQKTVCTQYASRDPKNRAFLNRMKGRVLSASDRKRLRKMFEESGAIEKGREMIAGYFDRAEHAVRSSGLTKKRQVPFLEIVEYIRARGN